MNFKDRSAAKSEVINLLGSAEAWIVRNQTALALFILAIGLVPRLYWAAGCYLNPDEAIHLGIAAESSLKGVYLDSQTLAHPPLFTLLLHFVPSFGSSELFFRLPGLFMATLGAWFGYKWAVRVAGAGIALGMLSLMTFLPGLMLPSVEVRQYGLLLMGILGALCFLERGLDEASGKWLLVGYLWLYTAILAHYSALWVTAAIGCYSLLRLYHMKARLGIWLSWICCNAWAVLIYLFIYITQISKMMRVKAGDLRGHAHYSYLKKGYYFEEDGSLFDFITSALHNVFRYLAGGHVAGNVALFLFFTGLAALLVVASRRGGLKRRDLALLLILPLVFGFGGTLLYLQPFLASRHVIFLFPFLAAGIAFGFFRWIKYPALAAVLISLAGPFWMVSALNGGGYVPNNNPFKTPRQDMVQALRFLDKEVPGEEVLLVDYQTFYTLGIYLGEDKPFRKTSYAWAFDRESLLSLLEEVTGEGESAAGDKRWVMSTGWWRPPLKKIIPESMLVRAEQFGQISLVQISMPTELMDPAKALAE